MIILLLAKFLNMFERKLINWYKDYKRDLPWRNTKDPYKIWLSEVILQQTRVNQGLDYYNKFITSYPDVQSLAQAPMDNIMKLWQGLGYYSRARNLHCAANEIMTIYNGIFPNNYNNLIKLKGIGKYTAAAISSIAFKEPKVVVDGNVYRVISRFKGIFTPINLPKAHDEFATEAQMLMKKADPGLFNQALMELGSLICTPQRPDCRSCPISSACYALYNNKINELPVRKSLNKPRNRYFNYLVITYNDKVIIKKRTQRDIWHSLYDFPLIESGSELTLDRLIEDSNSKMQTKLKHIHFIDSSGPHLHKLTHQTINASFYRFSINKNVDFISLLNSNSEFEPIETNKIMQLAVPRLIDKYIKNEFA